MRRTLTIVIASTAFGLAVVLWLMSATDRVQKLKDPVADFKSGRYEAAIPSLVRLADQGELTAVRLVALAYIHGHGVQANSQRAQQYVLLLDKLEQKDFCVEFLNSVSGKNDEVSSFWTECAK